MNKKHIELSSKYGLNQSKICCYWCGREIETISFGKITNNKGEELKAPSKIIKTDYPDNPYSPCKECEKKFKDKILVVEVESTNKSFLFITKGSKPTGNYLLFDNKKELIDRIVNSSLSYYNIKSFVKNLETSNLVCLFKDSFKQLL
jgi:hypothetical protein